MRLELTHRSTMVQQAPNVGPRTPDNYAQQPDNERLIDPNSSRSRRANLATATSPPSPLPATSRRSAKRSPELDLYTETSAFVSRIRVTCAHSGHGFSGLIGGAGDLEPGEVLGIRSREGESV